MEREPNYTLTRISGRILGEAVVFSKFFGYNDWAIFLEDCYVIESSYSELNSYFSLSELASVDYKKYNNINSRNLMFSPFLKRIEVAIEDAYFKINMSDEAAEGLKYLIARQQEEK